MSQAKTLKPQELRRVLDYVATRKHAARNRAMLLMTHLSGMRVGEVAALRLNDVLDTDGSVRSEIRLDAEQTKGNFARVVFVNEKAFQALPESVRKVVLEQAAIAETRGWTWSQRDNDETPKELVKNGMNLAPIGPAFKAELKKIGDQMLDDWLKKAGPDGQKIVDAYHAKLK